MTRSHSRRAELLHIAADLFAERGLQATTVRDIGDAAGMLSGSLYHHFDSKDAIVAEILRGFLDDLADGYRGVLDRKLPTRDTFEALVVASFASIDGHHAAVSIYQAESRQLVDRPRFGFIRDRVVQFRDMWHDVLRGGVADGSLRADLDVELTYRFVRDTLWAGASWYRPDSAITVDAIARQYLSIVLDGIAGR